MPNKVCEWWHTWQLFLPHSFNWIPTYCYPRKLLACLVRPELSGNIEQRTASLRNILETKTSGFQFLWGGDQYWGGWQCLGEQYSGSINCGFQFFADKNYSRGNKDLYSCDWYYGENKIQSFPQEQEQLCILARLAHLRRLLLSSISSMDGLCAGCRFVIVPNMIYFFQTGR